jgi:hypothetical protein
VVYHYFPHQRCYLGAYPIFRHISQAWLKTTHTHRLALTPPILPAVSPRASQRSTLQTAADSMLENNVKTKTLKVCCWENDGFL